MTKAVFTTRVNPTYDDLPEERYHFPQRYLSRVRETVGDWIIYYEPRRTSGAEGSRGGRQSYFATAKVNEIVTDPDLPEHYYALVSDFLEFPRAVPFRENNHIIESGLRHDDGRLNQGAFQWAIRDVINEDYDLILAAAFAPSLKATDDERPSEGLMEDPAPFQRPMVESIVRRPFRDTAFRTGVRAAYRNRCAVTGLRLTNGGGRPEVQAAHIMPVEDQGPDSIGNGLALSGTIHWMFDRGLISIDSDFSILRAEKQIPPELLELMSRNGGQILVPERESRQPAQKFLRYRRENRFKG